MFLSIKDAVKEFGVSAASLRDAAKQGKVPGARRVGGRWYVHRATMVGYFESAVPNAPEHATA